MIEFFRHPFPHVVIDNFIQKNLFEALIKDYPSKKDIKTTGKKSSSNRYNFMRGTEEQAALMENKYWANFKNYIENDFVDEMLNIFTRHKVLSPASFKRNNLVCEFDISRASTGYTRSCHLDRRHHLLSFLFYFNDKTVFGGRGGDLLLYSVDNASYEANDIFPESDLTRVEKCIEPKPNRLVGFLNTSEAYHGITPMMDNIGDRLFIYISIDDVDKQSLWPNEKLAVLCEERRQRFLNE